MLKHFIILLLFITASCQPELPIAEEGKAPIVKAGPDQTVVDVDNNGSQSVQLQGSATDPGGNITNYFISVNGRVVNLGPDAALLTQSLILPVGTHTILMEATNKLGFKASDSVEIKITRPVITPPVTLPPVNTAPVVKAGPDITITDSDKNGSEIIKLQGSATDAENNIVKYRVHKNGATYAGGTVPFIFIQEITLPVGSHTMTFEATDAAGLVGTDTVVINVVAPVVVNTAPVVNAGPDLSAEAGSNNLGNVTLLGSANDKENNIANYYVKQGSTILKSGTSASVLTSSLSLPPGSHSITLEAVDSGNLKGSDTVVVNITAPVLPPPGGDKAPIANAGPDIRMENTDYGLSVAKIKINGSASVGSNPIVRYVWKVNGVRVLSDSSTAILTNQEVFFIKGNNTLTLEVTDSAGLVGVDQAIVEVKPSLLDKPYGKSTVPELYSISSGGQRIAIDHDGNGVETVRMTGSITSVNPIVSYKWLWRGQVMASGTTPDVLTANITMPIGQFNLKLEAVDSAGNIMSDGFNLQVTATVKEQVGRIPSNFNTADYLVNSWYSGPSHWKDNSAFRFNCKASHYLFDDPIVFPGQPGKAHLHMFFGNTLANANSTYNSLRTTGNGSCDGGPLNRSAYWMPALMNENGKVVVPDHLTIYYKKHPGTNRLPRGLRMIFGFDHKNPDFTAKRWKCSSGGGNFGTIPEVTCPASENGNHTLMVGLSTPKCWDGVNLDSPDHRSHMAFPKYNNYGEATCPSTHPVTLPVFTMLVSWSHTGYAEYSKWRLSSDHTMPHDSSSERLPAGSSMHSDWFGAWDDEVMDKWHEGCMDGFKSCSGGALGTGKQLKRNPGFSFTTTDRIIDPPVKPISP